MNNISESFSNLQNQNLNKYSYIVTRQSLLSILLITVSFSYILFSTQVWASDRVVSILYDSANPLSKEFFDPKSINAKTGEEIAWINSDEMMHTVTEGNPSDGPVANGFDSGVLHMGQEFKVSFDKPGQYEYYCAFHPFMKGDISVTKSQVL
jgi:plastocyanin